MDEISGSIQLLDKGLPSLVGLAFSCKCFGWLAFSQGWRALWSRVPSLVGFRCSRRVDGLLAPEFGRLLCPSLDSGELVLARLLEFCRRRGCLKNTALYNPNVFVRLSRFCILV